MPHGLIALLVCVAVAGVACTAAAPAPSTIPGGDGAPAPPTAPAPTSAPTLPSATTSTPGSASETSAATTTTTRALGDLRLVFEAVADGFSQPVFVWHPPGDSRLFVVDQPGRIWMIADDDPVLFLDIIDRVAFGGERGLLSMAFHPGFADNGLFYANYTDRTGATVVAEFTAGPSSADPSSERIVLRIGQPAANHNGGMIAFGPDGNLWVGMGDGGASDDRFRNGQDDESLLGAMLRITVGPEIETYAVPDNGPFAAPEIWAIGVRNPWRFAFDGTDLWIADVGQNRIEEVNRVGTDDVGLNFGWDVFEGSECFGPATSCAGDGFVFPVAEYGRDEGCSITGGYVYRGAALPTLHGHYFFGDWCTGIVRSVAPDGTIHDWTEQTGSVPGLTSFGVDSSGELYVAVGDGRVLRLVTR